MIEEKNSIRYNLEVRNNLLRINNNITKELNKILREKGIVYDIYIFYNGRLLVESDNKLQTLNGKVNYSETISDILLKKLNIKSGEIEKIKTIGLEYGDYNDDFGYKFSFYVEVSSSNFNYSNDYFLLNRNNSEKFYKYFNSLFNLINHDGLYYCVCCGVELDGFSPGGEDNDIIVNYEIIGAGLRDNKNCKFCPSNDRERLVSLYFKEFILQENFKNIKLLHIAPEKMLSKIIQEDERIDYYRGDKFDGSYYYPNTIQLDIINLPFEEESFDFIICNHVLEHIENDLLALNNIYKVLKKGGRAILQAPISEKLIKTYEDKKITSKTMRKKYFGQGNHVRIYGKDYFDRIYLSGFELYIIDPMDFKSEDLIEKYGLNKNEKIILCEKN